GILIIACPEGEVEPKIEPPVFLSMVDDPEQSTSPYSTDPKLQPYFPKAWVSYQANRNAKERPHRKQVWFDGVEVPTHPSGQGNPCVASVVDKIVASAVPPLATKPIATNPLPSTQYRFFFGLEDDIGPKHVLNQVLKVSICAAL
ncbi:hypothetical protein PAXRUDRAFT_151591, partial [Paxillus rubicundulus Ve08.2h10]